MKVKLQNLRETNLFLGQSRLAGVLVLLMAGVFIAAGPAIRPMGSPRPLRELHRKDLPIIASIYDVAPTLLALAGVPMGRDMEGRVLTRILNAPSSPAPVASHDDSEWREARARFFAEAVQDSAEAERMSQLRALGYIE